jgi:type IV secretion system protein VirB4
MRWVNQQEIFSVGELMGLSELITPSIFMLENGCIGSIIQLSSESLAVKGLESLRLAQAVWHQVIMNLSEGNACMITEYRRRIEQGINQVLTDDFLSALIEPQVSGEYYQQDLFLTLLCKPAFSEKRKKREARRGDDRLITQLEQLQNLVLSLMKPFKPRLLTEKKEEDQIVSLLDALSVVVNAGYSISHKKTVNEFSLNPARLGDVLSDKQLLIGKIIHYLGMNEKEKKLGAIVSIKKYPPESSLQGSCPLSRLSFEWVKVQSFEPLAKDSGMRLIRQQRSKLKSTSDQAISQCDALSDLEDKVASESLTIGYHQYSVLIFADDEKSLDKNITDLQACLIEQGYGCVREALGLEMAFWGMQAGGIAKGVRKSLITSINFSHCNPIRGFSTGHRGKNHLNRPICLLETQEQMPYYFNFHTMGSRLNPSLGHTLVLGASNSGKTVLLTYLDAMRSGLGGKRFFFDRDKGAYLYFKAIGGQYLSFDPTIESMQLNPFSLVDTPETRRFLTTWLEQIALSMQEEPVSADDRAVLRSCVDYAYENLQPEQRYLSNVLRMLPRNYQYLNNFSPWIGAEKNEVEGEFCQYFDNLRDTLTFSCAVAFDMTYLLDQAPALLRKLVLMYLFYRIEKVCTGELVTITLDEGWQYFSDSYWRDKMRSWLPTLRKMNAHLVIATQSPSSIYESGVQDMVLDNCPTQIYFGNEKASEQVYSHFLRLSESELQVVRALVVSERWMLVKHGRESVVARLSLKKIARFIPILSASVKNIETLKSMQAEGVLATDFLVDQLLDRISVSHD